MSWGLLSYGVCVPLVLASLATSLHRSAVKASLRLDLKAWQDVLFLDVQSVNGVTIVNGMARVQRITTAVSRGGVLAPEGVVVSPDQHAFGTLLT